MKFKDGFARLPEMEPYPGQGGYVQRKGANPWGMQVLLHQYKTKSTSLNRLFKIKTTETIEFTTREFSFGVVPQTGLTWVEEFIVNSEG